MPETTHDFTHEKSDSTHVPRICQFEISRIEFLESKMPLNFNLAVTLGKNRNMIRSHGLSIDTTTQSTTLEFNSSFLYLHHIKNPADELKIVLQHRPSNVKKKKSESKGYLTLGYAALDMNEILQSPCDGLITLYKLLVVKKSVRSRLRGASSNSTKEIDDQNNNNEQDSDDDSGVILTAGAPSPLDAAADNISSRPQLGAPVARIYARVATVAVDRSSAFEDLFDSDGEHDGVSDNSTRNDAHYVFDDAVLDDDDQLLASLSVAERIRLRVDPEAKTKAPGKFRKWATKLRKRPTSSTHKTDEKHDDTPPDEKTQRTLSNSWPDDDSDSDAPQHHPPSPSSSLPNQSAMSASVSTSVNKNNQRAARNAAATAAATAARHRQLTSSGTTIENEKDQIDDDGEANTPSRRRRVKAKQVSAADQFETWIKGNNNTIALVNSTRRGAARVPQLWKSSTILSQDVPLLYYKDQNDLSIILGGALDKHCSTTQRDDTHIALKIVVVGDDRAVCDCVRPLVDTMTKKRRATPLIQFYLVPVGKLAELGATVAAASKTYHDCFFDDRWSSMFVRTDNPSKIEYESMADRIARYISDANRIISLELGEALLTLSDKDMNLTSSSTAVRLQEALPVLRSVQIGQRDSGEPLDLKLAYWTKTNKETKKSDSKEQKKSESKDKAKRDEQRELKSFQFAAIARLAPTAVALGASAPSRDTLALVAQPRDRKKGLAHKLAVKTTGRGDKDTADATIVANISKAVCGAMTDKKTFSVVVDDVVWDNVKFVSVAPQLGGPLANLSIQIF